VKAALLERLAPRPSLPDVRTTLLDEVVAELEASARGRADGGLVALDAGCGRRSPLSAYRTRLARLHGVDLHRPRRVPDSFDAFALVDLCRDQQAFPPGSIDLVLSNFTLEHLADPPAALANIRRWLRPGGRLVLTTVNRRHPFVGAYLALPPALRDRLQRVVKPHASEAHQLVGACNDPRAVRDALHAAGLERVRIVMVGHLARTWKRRWPAFLLGLLGDAAAQRFPSRRSTIVAVAAAPAA
jgi:SAM-dependent methyltransferase